MPALSIFGAASDVWCLLCFLSPSLELLMQIPETACLFCFEVGFGGMTETACKYRRTLVANLLPSSAPPLCYPPLLYFCHLSYPLCLGSSSCFFLHIFLSMFVKQLLLFLPNLPSPLLSFVLPMMKLSKSIHYMEYELMIKNL